MAGQVTGFLQWAVERLRARRHPVGAHQAEHERVVAAFRSTTVPLYGLPPDYQCLRSISWGSDVPMRDHADIVRELAKVGSVMNNRPAASLFETINATFSDFGIRCEYQRTQSQET
jgi:hypothetical protein